MALLVVTLVLLINGCNEPTQTRPPEGQMDRHTLIYGGDLFLARRVNSALFEPGARSKMLEGIAPTLSEPDLALVNLEGVATTGGYFYKLGNCVYMFRAHPSIIDEIKKAGVDLVTIGNNHMPDYGPDALIEMTDHLRKAGIGYTGAGVDLADAQRPVYRRVGDTVVGIVGAELTYAKRYEAAQDRAGVHYVREALRRRHWDRRIVKHFGEIAREMRRHAHVVIFTPHWDAHKTPPAVTSQMRELAKNLIDEAGFDAILAHGRHEVQGVEVFNGRPVMYDAGNLLLDFGTPGNLADETQGILWQIEFSRAGVHGVEGIPIDLSINQTTLARGAARDKVLDRVERLSKEYGTKLRIEDGRARLDLDPGNIEGPMDAPDPPRRPTVEKIRHAPNDAFHERLPGGVKRVNVLYENGIRLVGYELLAPSLRARKTAQQVVMLYWQTDRPQKGQYYIHLEARGKVRGRERIAGRHHIPGDWMAPTTIWPVGKVIQDANVVRLLFDPEGAVKFYAGLRRLDRWTPRNRYGTIMRPVESDLPLLNDQLIYLGSTPYSKQAPAQLDVYTSWRTKRDIELSSKQPWGSPPTQ